MRISDWSSDVCSSDLPEWYLNIVASPEIEFQIATQAFRATWREPVGAEREKVWSFFIDCHPFYANYQASTERVLPLVMFKPNETVPVFKEADATGSRRSEEHTSELQSLMRISYAVFCLKKKNNKHRRRPTERYLMSKQQTK